MAIISQGPIRTSSPTDSMDSQWQNAEDAQDDIVRKLADVQLIGPPSNGDSPIASLPNEILAKVFHQGHLSSVEDDVGFRSSISLVARHWREVAIDTSSLWARIVVKPHHPPEYVAVCLDRSKDRPLSIRFAYWEAISRENLHDILPLLSPSAHLWHELTIEYDEEDGMHLILRSFHDLEVPLLETMSVFAWYPPEHDVVIPIFTRGAPRLSNITLGGISLRSCWPPMDSVATFSVNAGSAQVVEASEFYEMLEAVRPVTKLVLQDMVTTWPAPQGTNTKICMDSLRHFMIHPGYWTAVDDRFLSHLLAEVISAPNLEKLAIRWGSQEIEDDFASPLEFPALTSLELWYAEFSKGPRDFLRCLPSITELTLVQCGSWSILPLLLDENEGPTLLPHLHTLTVQITSPTDGLDAELRTISLLCSLVSFRAKFGMLFQKLRLNSTLYTASPEHTKWLQDTLQVDSNDIDELAAP